MGYILKEDRLKYRPFTNEEKLKCMDKMLNISVIIQLR